MKQRKLVSAVLAGLSGVLLLAGCGPGEQGRPLNYQKGVYLGKPDTPLSTDTLRRLRERARYQAGLTPVVRSSGTESATEPARSDVRLPSPRQLSLGALRERAGRQSYQ